MWEVFREIITPVDLNFYILTFTRIMVAFILGGIVGYQRGSKKSPAGLKTHVLVCVGAALIMVLSEYLRIESPYADPTRFGAQVVSGIGFLGAGTILKEGNNVKGLTTAAGIWAVACVGLCAGAGFFGGAIIVTALITIGLGIISVYEDLMIKSKKRPSTIFVSGNSLKNVKEEIEKNLKQYSVEIKKTSYMDRDSEDIGTIKLDLKIPYHITKKDIKVAIKDIEGINQIY